jgi:hypothetical protein
VGIVVPKALSLARPPDGAGDRNLLLGRRRLGHGYRLGGAAPPQPLFLFARDSHGGILVGSLGDNFKINKITAALSTLAQKH